jgi:hypothetical protein
MIPSAAVVAAALLLGHLHLTAAESARFRLLTAIYADDQGVGFNRPEGVACDGTGRVVIADTGNDRVLRFTYREKALAGGTEIKISELSAPTRIRLGSKGDIYALDSRRHRIVHLGPEGEFKGALTAEGAPPPSTIVPRSFEIDATDTLYVLDVFSARVLVLDAAGTFKKALPLPADIGFAADVAVDAGRVLVLDSVKRRLYAAAKDATTFTPLGGDMTASIVTMPTAMATGNGDIFILEGGAGSIVSLARDGTFRSRQLAAGRLEGSLDHPTQICVNDKDEAFLADRDNSRVQVFGLLR